MSSDKDSGPPVSAGTMTVVGELLKAAADNPSVKSAGGELGRAAHTIAKTINIALLPLAALNFGYDKARNYFETRLGPDLEAKLQGVPPEEIIQPKPSLAGPVLQGLAFSHDESVLRDMYLNLLASAMTKKDAGNAHPAFAEIIKQLTAEEAASLLGALSPPEGKAIVQVRLQWTTATAGWRVLLNHLMPVKDTTTGSVVEVPNLPAMVDNWIRLGLVDVSYVEFLQTPPGGVSQYQWAEERPEVQRLRAAHDASPFSSLGRVIATPGSFRITAFGTAFANTVGVQKMYSEEVARAKKLKETAG